MKVCSWNGELGLQPTLHPACTISHHSEQDIHTCNLLSFYTQRPRVCAEKNTDVCVKVLSFSKQVKVLLDVAENGKMKKSNISILQQLAEMAVSKSNNPLSIEK